MSAPYADLLDTQGFLIVTGLIGPEEVTTAWRACAAALGGLGEGARTGDKTASGTRRLVELTERLPEVADLARRHPLLEVAAHVLGGPAELSALTYRAPQPGFGAQKLHADAGFPAGPGHWTGVTSILALVDFTADNGATRFVPGSHLLPHLLPRAARLEHHPDEQLFAAPAGSVLVFNAHLLHSGTPNRSGQPRHALQATYRVRSSQRAESGGGFTARKGSPA
ncbi:MAG: phytanoyl-CoA dioxygenase family protein [Actinomycetota bacterium]|nr:phytanoyl-CoA dioxygenase family protein [Actinomycetota bacterium]